MLYAAKCYWPGVTPADLQQVAGRAAATGLDTGTGPVTGTSPVTGTGPVIYLGCLLFAADDLVLCLFRGPSRTTVIQASDRIGIPRERLMDSAWLGPRPRDPGRTAEMPGRGRNTIV